MAYTYLNNLFLSEDVSFMQILSVLPLFEQYLAGMNKVLYFIYLTAAYALDPNNLSPYSLAVLIAFMVSIIHSSYLRNFLIPNKEMLKSVVRDSQNNNFIS
jgi:hypothetical protein